MRTNEFSRCYVITNLVGSVPVIGPDLLFLLWGSFSIDNVTLNRFYSLHFTIPFVVVFFTIGHFISLHENGSNHHLGITPKADNIPFTPYYGIKDFFGWALV